MSSHDVHSAMIRVFFFFFLSFLFFLGGGGRGWGGAGKVPWSVLVTNKGLMHNRRDYENYYNIFKSIIL